MMPGGPYPNVQYTGADQCWCPTCPQNVAQVYCWDGDNPGIAYYVPGSGNPPQVLSLPIGAHDPDIIVGREGVWGYVVYELGTDIVLHEFTCSPPVAATLSLGSATILSTNGRHPNIDREIDCEFSGSKVAVVYQNLTGIPDLEYYEGTFNSSFNGPLTITNLSTPINSPIRSYVNRTNPDINLIKFNNDFIYQFTFCGYENNIYYDNMVDYVHETSSIIGTNIFAPEIPLSINNLYDVKPRIDGNLIIFDPPQYVYTDQSYIITVESNNQIFYSHANALSPSWTDINISGTFAQKPAIAVHGDFADIIWSNNFHGKINILGTEIHGTIHSSIYKDGNVNITSGYNFFVSIHSI
ncbi:hypothetical protein JCM31826_00010 [Thermaurantimonas aggregans]|uniref:Uncharacterized protein n=1 Tax=Thermaurantimonas aggregans TaxID=2173829 RepID=A0A401XHN4_9FLAO|nr:hypothetical protein [Thermaurantimonas aggregans]MCX8149817.1 hypothetical protein [Thermaurantimonas aggregans]GCD76519.1 hypothetical protein JCM31826_00010 [Thermaurantimonas aggregans]